MLRRLHRSVELDNVNTNAGIEWAWAVTRFIVGAVVLLGSMLLIQDEGAVALLRATIVAAYVYNSIFVLLLLQDRVRAVFFIGMACDTGLVVAGMVGFMRLTAGMHPTDLYLVLFPIITVGVARLGWALGSMYTVFWLTVFAWATLAYFPPDAYGARQLPLRLVFMAGTALLVMRLVVLLQRERRLEAERAHVIEQTERLKSALLHSVSHQLKTPLTAVQAASDLLTTPPQELTNEQQKRAGSLLRNGVHRLRKLTQASLDYARLSAAPAELRTEDVDLTLAVGSVIASLQDLSRSKKQTVTFTVAGSAPLVRADPAHVREVLISVLENAHKFSPPGGDIQVCLSAAGRNVRIEVTDSGPGVPEDDRPGLFHVYYRGKAPDTTADAGTGLGLAIAKLLVELYGGRIGYEVSARGGSTFFFTLPAKEPAVLARR